MKMKKLLQSILIVSCLAMLAACSSNKKHGAGSGSYSDANGSGAESSGMGQGSNFGDDSNLSPEQLLHKRVYHFEYDRSEVRDSDKPAIFANADYLMAHPNAHVIVEGHTDPRGS